MHADIVSSRRAMLRYYTVTFAFLLTTNLENNCFLSGRSLSPPPPPFRSSQAIPSGMS